MAQSVVENRYSTFKASHDVSKSHTMSRLALWWIDVHPPGEAFVVTTAPTTPQVEAILWRYMGNAHRKANLSGRITLDDIDPDDDKLGTIKWGIDSRGRIKIESKDDMRKRGLPSPDRADAMAIAFAGRADAAPMNVESHAGESITGDLMSKAW
jgi:hypothetical protein